MPIERSNVPGLAQPPGYTHLATVSEARLVFIAGQVPLNERGELVGQGQAGRSGADDQDVEWVAVGSVT
jgi:enamine deaminase RidA (YjgF/YER057c/UK114 family)